MQAAMNGKAVMVGKLLGTGVHPDFRTAVAEMTHVGDTFDPDPKNRAIYDGLYHEVYRRMYRRLRPLYEKIRDITGYPRPRS